MSDYLSEEDYSNISLEITAVTNEEIPNFTQSTLSITPTGREVPKTLRKQTSWVWEYFKEDGSGKKFCMIDSCKNKSIPTKYPKNTSTTNLAAHLRNVHKLNNEHIKRSNQMILDSNLSVKKCGFNPTEQAKILKAIMEYIVENKEPFKLVEKKSFRKLMSVLVPFYECPSKSTILRCISDNFNRKEDWFKGVLNNITSMVGLTLDGWSSRTIQGYMVITVHWIDSNWILQNSILDFVYFPPPHNTTTTYELVLKILEKWGIVKKVRAITTDSASEMAPAIELLRLGIINQSNIHIEPSWHVRCVCHIINRAVQDALLVLKPYLVKLRSLLKKIRHSSTMKDEFKRLQAILKFETICDPPCLDVETRWNSAFIMMHKSYKLKVVFEKLIDNVEYKSRLIEDSLSNEEWEMMEAFKNFFSLAKEYTTVASAKTYPTISVQPLIYDNLVLHCQVTINDPSLDFLPLRQAANLMLEKLDKYQSFLKSDLAKIALFLDPRESNQGTSQAIISKVRNILEIKYGYIFENLIEPPKKRSLFGFKETIFTETKGDEIQEYMLWTAKKVDDKTDIINWWKTIGVPRFPFLSKLAKDTLMVMASSVPSESAFSDGGQIITAKRSKMKPENLEILMKLRSWNRLSEKLSNNSI